VAGFSAVFAPEAAKKRKRRRYAAGIIFFEVQNQGIRNCKYLGCL
jgi:hypothetical protein